MEVEFSLINGLMFGIESVQGPEDFNFHWAVVVDFAFFRLMFFKSIDDLE